MEIEEALYSYLSTHATVGALVGTRGYPMTIPQEAKRPCWAYQVISHGEIMDHDGLSKLRTCRVQFTVQGTSYWQAKELTREIGKALRGYKGMMGLLQVDSAEVLNEFDGYGTVGEIYTIRLDIGLMYRSKWVDVYPPAAFTMAMPFRVGRDDRVFEPLGWDVSDMEPETVATMYVSPSGDDTKDGSTLILAKRTLENAIGSMTSATTIWVNDGIYIEGTVAGYGGHWRAASPAYNLSIKAINPGMVFQGPWKVGLSWSVYDAPSHTYQASYATTVQSVRDKKSLTIDDDYVKLTAKASIAEVQANAGSWYQTGSVVYVRLADNRVPDSDLMVMISMPSCHVVKDNITIYMEGIEFQGGPNGAAYMRNNSAAGGLKVYAKDCKFKYSFATGGFAAEGTTLTILQDCESASNDNDGYNYHVRNGVVPDAIEINCVGRNNGWTTDADNNGSSIHDGGRICRIMGNYGNTYGQVIIDINGALSWNLGVEAHHGLVAGISNFFIDGTMWLDRCWSHDHSVTGYDLHVLGAGDALYYRELDSDGDYVNYGGTLAQY